jgi:hypothetical protein
MARENNPTDGNELVNLFSEVTSELLARIIAEHLAAT